MGWSVRASAAVCVVAACLGGCGSGPGDGGSGGAGGGGIHAPDYTGAWMLRSVEGVEVGSIVDAGERVPSVVINHDGSVTGFGGVNRLSTSFDGGGERVFGPVVSTKMAGPEHLMALESRMVSAMGEARAASIEGGELVLLDGAGRELARFVGAAR